MGFVARGLRSDGHGNTASLWPPREGQGSSETPDHGEGVGVAVGGCSFCWIMSRMNA